MSWLQRNSNVDAFATHATVFACVTKIAQALSSVPWKVMTGTDENPTEILDGPWYRLLTKPNPLMSRNQLKSLTATFMATTGECFWVLDNGTDPIIGETEIPLFLWPKSGNEVTEVVDPATGQLRGWRIAGVRDKVSRDYPLHAVIHLPWTLDPTRPWRGASPLRAAMASVLSDVEAMSFNRNYYANGASPSLIVTSKDRDLTPAQAKEVQRSINDGWQGTSKAGKVLALPSGMDAKETNASFRDMQFLQGLEWGRGRIAETFGVPLALLSDSKDVNFNTFRQSKRQFYEQTIVPLVRTIEDQIEVQLIEPRLSTDEAGSAKVSGGRAVWVAFGIDDLPVMQDDRDTKLASAAKAQSMGFTKNEVNEEFALGFDADDEIGDVRFLPTTLQTADSLVNPPEPPPALAPFAGVPPGEAPKELPPGTPPPPAKDPKGEKTGNPEPPVPQRSRDLTADRKRRDVLWRKYDADLRPHERAYRAAFSNFFHKKTKEAVQWMEGERAGKTAEEIACFLAEKGDAWRAELQALVRPLNLAAAASGVRQMEQQLGVLKTMTVAHPNLLRFLADKELKITSVADTMIEGLRATLLEGVAANETTAELADRIRNASALSKSSALRIARTESNQVVSGSRFETARTEGVTRIEWTSSRDAMVRDQHQELDGEVRSIDESFVPGQTLRYPGDVECGDPTLVVNCRCSAGPAPE